MTDQPLTNADFSRVLSYIAKNSAAWAGDVLELPEDAGEPADQEAVARYVGEARRRLDYLERWALAGKREPQP